MSDVEKFMGRTVSKCTMNNINRYKKIFRVQSDDLLLDTLYQRGRALSYSLLNLKHEIDNINEILVFYDVNLGVNVDA